MEAAKCTLLPIRGDSLVVRIPTITLTCHYAQAALLSCLPGFQQDTKERVNKSIVLWLGFSELLTIFTALFDHFSSSLSTFSHFEPQSLLLFVF